MNRLKMKFIWLLVIGLLGLFCLIIGIYGNNNIILSMGIALLVISIIRFFNYSRIIKDPELIKEQEIRDNEERLVFISDKSRSLMFSLTIILEVLAVLLTAILDKNGIAAIICYVISIQVIMYLIIYYYNSKRY